MSLSTRLLSASALAFVASTAQADLLIFDYSGFENPEFHPAYIAEHGASPEFAFFGDEDEAFQKIVSGFKVDVSHVCAGSVTKWRESGILEAWDTSKIDAFADLDKNLIGQNVAEGAEAYFIPTDFGSTAIAYNTDQVPAEDVASLDVFLNPKYAGRVTIPDNVDDAFALAYLATGVTDWSAGVTDAQFDAASDWLRQAHQNLRTYWVDPGELAQLLGSGEVLVSWAWNETLPTMVEQDFPIGFEREAAEGSSLWLCGYVNLADAPGDEQLAYDYLNAMLAPEATVGLLDAGFGQANAVAMAAQGEGALVASGLGEISAPVLAQLPMTIELREKHNETFERIKAGF